MCPNHVAYDCTGLGGVPGERCRMNSLNEIAEACMSEIVEESACWCGHLEGSCWGGGAPMLTTDWVERFHDDVSWHLECQCL